MWHGMEMVRTERASLVLSIVLSSRNIRYLGPLGVLGVGVVDQFRGVASRRRLLWTSLWITRATSSRWSEGGTQCMLLGVQARSPEIQVGFEHLEVSENGGPPFGWKPKASQPF